MIDCICEYGRNIPEGQRTCPHCGTDLTPLNNLKALPRFYYEKGIKLAKQKEWNLAIEQIKIAISLNPNLAEAYLALGNVYFQNGLCDLAIIEYEKGLTAEPDNEDLKEAKITVDKLLPSFYYEEGIKLIKQQQWNLAIEKLNRSKSLNPSLTEVYLVLGKIYLHVDRRDLAIAEYEEGLRIQPSSEELKKAKMEADKPENDKKEQTQPKKSILNISNSRKDKKRRR